MYTGPGGGARGPGGPRCERLRLRSKRSKQNPCYAHQGFDKDRLFNASCEHVRGPDCRGCDMADHVESHPSRQDKMVRL